MTETITEVMVKLSTLATLGAIVIFYLLAMNWSLTYYVRFRALYRLKKLGYTGDKYTWREIVSIPVYILLWTPAILAGMLLIGGFVQLILWTFGRLLGLQ